MDRSITLCAAQIAVNDDSTAANVEKHLAVLRLAAGHGAHCVVFPELSLTGYCVEKARAKSITLDAPELETIRNVCDELGLSAVFGAPLRDHEALFVGACICRPGLPPLVYCKQNLHGQEHTVYSPGTQSCVLPVHDRMAGYAICADADKPVLAMTARALGAELYLAGVVCSEPGYASMCAALREQALGNAMTVLMANHAGLTGRYLCVGGSTVWKPDGSVAVHGPAHEECLVLCAMDDDGGYAGSVHAL